MKALQKTHLMLRDVRMLPVFLQQRPPPAPYLIFLLAASHQIGEYAFIQQCNAPLAQMCSLNVGA